MRDADQSTFDVVATNVGDPAAVQRTIPSRNAVSVTRPMIPTHTITRSPSRVAGPPSSIDENRMRRNLPHTSGNRTGCIGHAHDAFRAQDETSRQ
ncbi:MULTISPECIES: hypothetical protein [Burkholderia]|uniref:Uncharacterized protein n=1 Tax=Burkholderia sola TaxID=2843302 RepID=A0ABV2C0Q6_9BURK|nr:MULTISPECIES: hypothetical protein [unclassified Burkholderia]MBP0604773.1 hypothetical protein [Burkholderia sp. CpTa8-5]MBP0715343.1 hypothetical protein [Burkholderia sp. AcTa6-5]